MAPLRITEFHVEHRTLGRTHRRALWERDRGQCGICNQAVSFAECQMDHIIPWHEGGRTTPENIRIVHGRCNAARNRWRPRPQTPACLRQCRTCGVDFWGAPQRLYCQRECQVTAHCLGIQRVKAQRAPAPATRPPEDTDA